VSPAHPVIGRRAAVGALAWALAAAAAPAWAQPARVVRIGWLSAGSPTTFATRLAAFRGGLRDLGHPDDAVFIEQRWTEGRDELLPELAGELVRLRVNLLLTVGTPATLAAKQATDAIPIVMVAVGDPVASGIVAGLARPGGNVTGISNLAAELSGKLLDLLREAVPGLTRVAVLQNPANPVHASYWRETLAAAERLGLKVQPVEARRPEDFEPVFAAAARQQVGGIIVLPDPLPLINRARVIELAARHRLPAIYAMRDYADAGGLMSYGPNSPDLYRRAATYVDKVLKGARPAELPVEQPTKFDFVINVKTARALGLALPQSLLIRADQLIQ
jgi:putative ABC transport system substrate-binding protein